MTFWEALPQIADIGGLTLGFLLLVGVFFAIIRLVLPAAKLIQELIKDIKDNYKELLAKAEASNERDLADERAERERLEKRLDKTDEELERMSGQLDSRDKQLVNQGKQLVGQGEQLAELSKLLNAMQTTNDQKDKTIEEMRQAIRALENHVAELQTELNRVIFERDDFKERLDIAQKEIALLQTGIEVIQKRDTDKLPPLPCDDEDDKPAAEKKEAA
jgi:chromosome segregation ATPase